MAQLVIAAGSAAIGFAIGGPTGAQIGWALGSIAGASLNRPAAPAVGDLTAPTFTYGVQIPRIYGTYIVAGTVAWVSTKRATAQHASGKGGSPVTGYSYSADALYILSAEAPAGAVVSRIWADGKLVYSRFSGATTDTLTAPAPWDAIDFFDGNASQAPWTVYEAAVTTAHALAYRHRFTVGITNLQWNSPPLLKFELTTAPTPTVVPVPKAYLFNGRGYSTGAGSTPDFDTYSGALTYARYVGDWRIDIVGASVSGVLSGDDVQIFQWVNYAGMVSLYYADASLSTNGIGTRIHVTVDGAGMYLAYGSSGDLSLVYSDATGMVTILLNGMNVGTLTAGGSAGVGTVTSTKFNLGLVTSPRANVSEGISLAKLTGNFDHKTVYAPQTIDLAAIVTAECAIANIPSSRIDVSDLVGIPVRGFAANGGLRAGLEELAAAFYFGCYCTDKLYFKRRGGSSISTVPFIDLGATESTVSDDPLGLTIGNDDEIPRKVALTYVNQQADGDPGVVTGDRGAGPASQAATAQTAVVFTPSEAQVVVNAWANDAKVAATTFKAALTDAYAKLTPTDVVTLADDQGNTYRARVVQESYQRGVKSIDLVLDDATLLTQPGIATDYTTPNIQVVNPGMTTLLLLDIPILRDADNDPAFYYAVNGGSAWPGTDVYESADGVTYTNLGADGLRANTGTTSTVLAAPANTWLVDAANTVTVSCTGTLTSYSFDDLMSGLGVNYLLGSEVIQAMTATLVSPGVYTLSNLLRGLRGTEWACGSHVTHERFVVLDPAKLTRGTRDASQLGITYSYKTATLGGGALSSAQTFTDTGIGLKPYAPVDLKQDSSGGPLIVSWDRRPRLSSTFLGTTQPQLGESSESYAVELWNGSTLVNAQTVTAPSATITGSSPGYHVTVYQNSAIVGRGYPATLTL